MTSRVDWRHIGQALERAVNPDFLEEFFEALKPSLHGFLLRGGTAWNGDGLGERLEKWRRAAHRLRLGDVIAELLFDPVKGGIERVFLGMPEAHDVRHEGEISRRLEIL